MSEGARPCDLCGEAEVAERGVEVAVVDLADEGVRVGRVILLDLCAGCRARLAPPAEGEGG